MAENKTFTQEELDEVIKDRLAREKKTHQEALDKLQADIAAKQKTIDDLNAQVSTHGTSDAAKDKEIADLKAKVSGYETDSAKRKIADEFGLDSKALPFIQGANEEEFRQSATVLKGLIGDKQPPAPLKNDDAPISDSEMTDASWKEMLDAINGNT